MGKPRLGFQKSIYLIRLGPFPTAVALLIFSTEISLTAPRNFSDFWSTDVSRVYASQCMLHSEKRAYEHLTVQVKTTISIASEVGMG